MIKLCMLALAGLALSFAAAATQSTTDGSPENVIVQNGSVRLHALFWRPQGRGQFPAILFIHGSGRTPQDLKRLGPYEQQAYVLGPVFARHGYAFLYLFRRGVGLSTDQGTNAVDLMNSEMAARGQAARDALQLRLLQTREMTDVLAGLALLRARPGVDGRDVAAIGHSFGGSLTLLMAERQPDLRAVIVFSAAGYSWDRSPELRARLFVAETNIKSPVFFIHAANDYSIASGKALDARMREIGKPSHLKIYPPIGHTPEEGHEIPYLGVKIWEPDVFAFLDKYMRRHVGPASR
jgi:pimeloyl-ACP methyl ester carboxylesterase